MEDLASLTGNGSFMVDSTTRFFGEVKKNIMGPIIPYLP